MPDDDALLPSYATDISAHVLSVPIGQEQPDGFVIDLGTARFGYRVNGTVEFGSWEPPYIGEVTLHGQNWYRFDPTPGAAYRTWCLVFRHRLPRRTKKALLKVFRMQRLAASEVRRIQRAFLHSRVYAR